MAAHIAEHKKITKTTYKLPLKEWELEKIIGVTDVICGNLSTPFSIEALVKMSGIHHKKLQTGFKYLFGQSVAEFIKNYRIEKAQELLQTTDFTISEVANEVGISSRSYFSKSFKEITGILPAKYKALYQSESWSFELSYKSRARMSFTSDMLQELISLSDTKNNTNGITGCLVYYHGEFFQFIEGPKIEVLELYKTIEKDSRHTDIELLWKGARQERVFKNYGMALVTNIESEDIVYDGLDLGVDLRILNEPNVLKGVPALRFWHQIRNRIRGLQRNKINT